MFGIVDLALARMSAPLTVVTLSSLLFCLHGALKYLTANRWWGHAAFIW